MNTRLFKSISIFFLIVFSMELTAQLSQKLDSIVAAHNTIEDANMRVIAMCKKAQRIIGKDMQLSIALVDKATQIAKNEDALEGLQMCYMTQGGISYFKADYDEAIANFYKAIEISDKNGELSIKDAGILGNIGVIYKKQGNLQKALNVQLEALAVFKNNNDSMGISVTLTNMGEVFRIQKQFDKALASYEQSAEIKLTIGHQSGLGIVYNNMGLCYSEKGDFKKAEQFLNKAYGIEKEIGNKVRISETELDLANHYYLSKEYAKSIKYAEQAVTSSQELGLKGNVADLYLILSQNYEALNNYSKAHRYYKLFFEEREQLLNEDINEKIAEMDVKYETAQREKELEKKNFEISAQEAEIERNKLQRNAIAVVLLLSFIIVYFLYRANTQNKQIANLMKGQNLLIEKKNQDLENINTNVEKELEKLQIALGDKEEILNNIFASKQQLELPPELLSLSKREMEVMSYLTLGWSDQEIADKLFVSKSTTKTHLRRIYSKLMVNSRTEAVNIALKYNLIGSV